MIIRIWERTIIGLKSNRTIDFNNWEKVIDTHWIRWRLLRIEGATGIRTSEVNTLNSKPELSTPFLSELQLVAIYVYFNTNWSEMIFGTPSKSSEIALSELGDKGDNYEIC